jgi:endonuclease/exonuclease/phosphatase (EEP) superfamily protein YafD
MLTNGAVRASDGRVLPPVGSDHLPIRACLRVV